jgi:AcrR family transcriptional regulator
MVQNQQQDRHTARRPRGRPQVRSDEDTRHLIIQAAAHEFQASGYAMTNVCAVAQRAGVSTKTLYRLIPTKADLFASVISNRAQRFLLAIDEHCLGKLDLVASLERILVAYGSLTLSKEVVAINRLVIGERERFPEIASLFYDSAIMPVNAAIERWLRRRCEEGLIRLDDVALAAGMLRGMMTMEPQRLAILGQRAAPDEAEIVARAKLCARLFLDGCRT